LRNVAGDSFKYSAASFVFTVGPGLEDLEPLHLLSMIASPAFSILMQGGDGITPVALLDCLSL